MSESSLPTFAVKWSGKEFPIEGLSDSTTLADLKQLLMEKTGVRVERQKIMGLKCKDRRSSKLIITKHKRRQNALPTEVSSRPAGDTDCLKDMGVKEKQKLMMIGSLEESIREAAKAPNPEEMPEVVNDLSMEEDIIAVADRPEFLDKIQKRVETIEIKEINAPREGKKLLVLDIDYTLFDHKSSAESAAELKRPFLHEFLASAYEDYDIVIWSATSMKWVDVKMKELGVTGHEKYKILFHLDSSAMISVWIPDKGLIDCKPLGVIWGKYPQYNRQNTIMFDDVSRNFIMNPQNGLKIKPFRDAHFTRDEDRELIQLARYLKCIARLDDFTKLRHRKWERYLDKYDK
ncbi:ubiquitin-like domain-containing CTD phosphatase 1 isoform X2 [Varroa destructor]|nr:ubiquitin-like domain-containing CTD phosphatase 1 isoform X2 [Varroa destructor]